MKHEVKITSYCQKLVDAWLKLEDAWLKTTFKGVHTLIFLIFLIIYKYLIYYVDVNNFTAIKFLFYCLFLFLGSIALLVIPVYLYRRFIDFIRR